MVNTFEFKSTQIRSYESILSHKSLARNEIKIPACLDLNSSVCKIRDMPKRNPYTHTPQSVEVVMSRLKVVLADIQVSKDLMELEPPMGSVSVEWQTALSVGLDRLRTWADALRDAVDEKRMDLASNGVSGTGGEPKKQRKKTL
jgi:hypothetical protein